MCVVCREARLAEAQRRRQSRRASMLGGGMPSVLEGWTFGSVIGHKLVEQ